MSSSSSKRSKLSKKNNTTTIENNNNNNKKKKDLDDDDDDDDDDVEVIQTKLVSEHALQTIQRKEIDELTNKEDLKKELAREKQYKLKQEYFVIGLNEILVNPKDFWKRDSLSDIVKNCFENNEEKFIIFAKERKALHESRFEESKERIKLLEEKLLKTQDKEEESSSSSSLWNLKIIPETKVKGEGRRRDLSFCGMSTVGSKNGGPQENQDSMFFHIFPKNKFSDGEVIFGVLDGHGVDGHDVARFYEKRFVEVMAEMNLKELSPKEAIEKTLAICNSEMIANKDVESNESGCCATFVLFHGKNELTIANIGDCRLVGGKSDGKPKEITEDHKPEIPKEKSRILECGGVIKKLGLYGPERICYFYANPPGLSFSRSLGDQNYREIGIISKPEYYHVNLENDDKYLILASDGVWTYTKPNEATYIFHQNSSNMELARERFYKYARNSWDFYIDDITFFLIRLD